MGWFADDNRVYPRRRTRLRPVKIAGMSRQFLDEGTLYDLSKGGARIRRIGDRPLPRRFLLLDEVELKFWQVALVWESGREAGVRFIGSEIKPTRAETLRLTGRYYALTD
ncbi:hypothetical protein LQ948_01475 [Jiella sp. MQZ9-1]|uniref:PilZ domain-containing protein n=1 Tax=Jiella flava TaxID=2816857 RepID=A0A939FTP7_9HYPH|nr:hypothetical protein [Jiella flava]MBO0661230.1 hypothetical protein [Jiella flava]MCD2469875.1 hypothetical protein [Jiella flava]